MDDAYSSDDRQDDEVFYLSELPPSSCAWEEAPCPSSDYEEMDKWQKTTESMKRYCDTVNSSVRNESWKKEIIPWTTMSCGGPRVSGTERCTVIPLVLSKASKKNNDSALTRVFCACKSQNSFKDVSLLLYFDLCELVVSKKLHLNEGHGTQKTKKWDKLALEFVSRKSMLYFKDVKGSSINKSFQDHVDWYKKTLYSSSSYDPKDTTPYHDLLRLITVEQDREESLGEKKSDEKKTTLKNTRNYYSELTRVPNSAHYNDSNYRETEKATGYVSDFSKLYGTDYSSMKEIYNAYPRRDNSLSTSIGNVSSGGSKSTKKSPTNQDDDPLVTLINQKVASKQEKSSSVLDSTSDTMMLSKRKKEIEEADYLDDDTKELLKSQVMQETSSKKQRLLKNSPPSTFTTPQSR